MGTLGRLCTSALLALVLTVLAVPAGLHLAESIGTKLDPAETAESGVPAAQQPPERLSAMTAVTELTGQAPLPEPDVLAAQLSERLQADAAGAFTGAVLDAETGAVLYDNRGSEPQVPASNLKLLTAAAALETMGTGHRFSTTAVLAQPDTVVLKAGGDVLLSAGESDPDAVLGHAGLASLAAQTVDALAQTEGSGDITVAVDDTLFTGPAVNPNWPAGDLAAGQVAPIYPIALNSGRFSPEDRYGPRPQDAAMDAGAAFADALREAGEEAGISVSAQVRRAAAPADAVVLGEVQSAPVVEQVELMLHSSDNYLAEALSRMTALAAGRPASFAGATATIAGTVTELGIAAPDLVVVDASGLSVENRLSPVTLTRLLRVVVTTEDSDLAAVAKALPVAGLDGTLDDRFTVDPALAGAGLVRAKTGTLNSALALSGHVATADGRLLVFSFIGNGLGTISAANEQVLDEAAALLASCGCR